MKNSTSPVTRRKPRVASNSESYRKPSDEILRVLQTLRDRIANLYMAKTDAEFDRLNGWSKKEGHAFIRDSRQEVEDVLDGPFLYLDKRYPLRDVYRTECRRAGSLDSDAIDVMRDVFDAVYQARQWALRITAPSKTPDQRENKKVFDRAEAILLALMQAVKTCASGVNEKASSSSEVSQPNSATQNDGPISEDCRLFRIRGVEISLTPMQAAIVAIFWEARKSGIGELSESAVLEKAGSRSLKLRDLFKTRSNGESITDPNWTKLFKPGSKRGLFSLNESK